MPRTFKDFVLKSSPTTSDANVNGSSGSIANAGAGILSSVISAPKRLKDNITKHIHDTKKPSTSTTNHSEHSNDSGKLVHVFGCKNRHPSGEKIEDHQKEYAILRSTIRKNSPEQLIPAASFKSKLMFHCQLAHGSPTGLISGFSDVADMYTKMANCYDLLDDDILYCTLNTHKVDMQHLLTAQLSLDDFIFIHIKGQKKEIDLVKTDTTLGLTLTDNGAGKTFIKRIKPETVFGSSSNCIFIGDHIEKINNESVLGKRHSEVADMLKAIPVGTNFSIRLIEPLKAGFSSAQPQVIDVAGSHKHFSSSNVNGIQRTLRFKPKGLSNEVSNNAGNEQILEKLNSILEQFLGITDKDLALSLFELGQDVQNPKEFNDSLKKSDFAPFEIPDEVGFDLWGAIKDYRDGRLDEQPSGSGVTSTKL